jgi:hypothetical protein
MSTPTNGALFPAKLCGASFSNLLPPNDDVRVCQGTGVDGSLSNQLQEVMDDEGDFGYKSMRILQPFDFTNRTGRLVMDVDAKNVRDNLGHGWWVEVWITEDPAPMPYHGAPTVKAYPRNGLGFAFQFGGGCSKNDVVNGQWLNALETVHVMKNYQIVRSMTTWDFDYYDPSAGKSCFRVADAQLNHLEFRINQDQAEFWVSDANNPGSFRLAARLSNLDLPFTRGYVHLQHAAYNATKDAPVSPLQTYRWDNIGFDGPTYPTPRVYEVPDNTLREGGRIRTGYKLMDGETHILDVEGVDLTNVVAAKLNFNIFAAEGQRLEYRINNSDWMNFTVVGGLGNSDSGVRAFSIPITLSQLLNGKNTLSFRMNNRVFHEVIGNIDIALEVSQ